MTGRGVTRACAVVAAALAAGAGGGGPRFEVVSPKDIGVAATGINGRGDVVGFEWVEEPGRPGVVGQSPFLARGKAMTYLPNLAGYTATFPAAVSDDGLVVGRAGKAAPPGVRVALRNQAIVWDEAAGIRGLGALPGDVSSFACGVARDGRRVSGVSVGPDRVRACVWERQGVGGGWAAEALPQEGNLTTQLVVISGNGARVAAVDGGTPCLWSRGERGGWSREAVGGAGSFVPRAVNDSGTIAGVATKPGGTTRAVVWSKAGGVKDLEPPPGYTFAEANALNNAGDVVGMVDGPHGSDVGPDAFVVEGGRLRLLSEGGPNFTAATAINDRRQVAGVLEAREK